MDAMSVALISARSEELLTTVVGRALPFQRTMLPATKLVPLTFRVNPPPPATMVAGFKLTRVGIGLTG